ncbi:MAG: helix-turn-helix transcriptional regulator [Oscillospiraceae bacterium]|nr:helix-turn-helix transcriptional regulator [Oscillospiraceae bacterium]
MEFNANKVGEQIASLRRNKKLTQTQLGERLNVSTQAVSKWERGESMPDISLLSSLAAALETTTDNILTAGSLLASYNKKITVKQVVEIFALIEKAGTVLGRDNYFYLGIIEGINTKMNIDVEEYLTDDYTREALMAEAIIQCIQSGTYIDISDVRREFKHEHWINIITDFAKRNGIT